MTRLRRYLGQIVSGLGAGVVALGDAIAIAPVPMETTNLPPGDYLLTEIEREDSCTES